MKGNVCALADHNMDLKSICNGRMIRSVWAFADHNVAMVKRRYGQLMRIASSALEGSTVHSCKGRIDLDMHVPGW